LGIAQFVTNSEGDKLKNEQLSFLEPKEKPIEEHEIIEN